MRLIPFFLILFASLLGCGRSVPNGFPNLKPTRITITDGGTPLDGVTVILISKQDRPNLFFSGITDAKGIAIMKTTLGNYAQAGTPVGEYTVLLSKNVVIDTPGLSEAEYYALTPKQRSDREKEFEKKTEAARIVPKLLGDAGKTPLSLNVGEEGGKLDVDIAEYKKK